MPLTTLIPQMLLGLRALYPSHHLPATLDHRLNVYVITAYSQPSPRYLPRNDSIRHHDLRRFGCWSRRAEAYYVEGVGWKGGEGEWRGWTVSGVGGSVGVCGYQGRYHQFYGDRVWEWGTTCLAWD